MNYYYTLITMAIIKNNDNTKFWQGCRETRSQSLICCWRECKVAESLWKTLWLFLKNCVTIIGPNNYTPGYLFQRNKHSCSHKTSTRRFCCSLLCNSPKLETTRCPPWERNKTNGDLSLTWNATLLSNHRGQTSDTCNNCINLQRNMPSEKRCSQQVTGYIIPFT